MLKLTEHALSLVTSENTAGTHCSSDTGGESGDQAAVPSSSRASSFLQHLNQLTSESRENRQSANSDCFRLKNIKSPKTLTLSEVMFGTGYSRQVVISALFTCMNMIGCYQSHGCEWANHCVATGDVNQQTRVGFLYLSRYCVKWSRSICSGQRITALLSNSFLPVVWLLQLCIIIQAKEQMHISDTKRFQN